MLLCVLTLLRRNAACDTPHCVPESLAMSHRSCHSQVRRPTTDGNSASMPAKPIHATQCHNRSSCVTKAGTVYATHQPAISAPSPVPAHPVQFLCPFVRRLIMAQRKGCDCWVGKQPPKQKRSKQLWRPKRLRRLNPEPFRQTVPGSAW